MLLRSGCVCCTLRGDLADELRDLLSRRERGEIPAFRRVVVETTGLADPAPIVYTLLSEPVVRHHYDLETVVATVDAVNGLRHEESLKQVGDRRHARRDEGRPRGDDARGRPGSGAQSRRRRSSKSSFGDVEPARLFGRPARDPRDVTPSGHEHEDGIRAVCLFLDDELDWTAFGVWLTMLLQARGEDVLRVKGLLNVGAEGPLLVNGVQHAVHPPEHLDAWPDEDRRSRIVFIGRGFDGGRARRSLAVARS